MLKEWDPSLASHSDLPSAPEAIALRHEAQTEGVVANQVYRIGDRVSYRLDPDDWYWEGIVTGFDELGRMFVLWGKSMEPTMVLPSNMVNVYREGTIIKSQVTWNSTRSGNVEQYVSRIVGVTSEYLIMSNIDGAKWFATYKNGWLGTNGNRL